jgi:hypothetical protein
MIHRRGFLGWAGAASLPGGSAMAAPGKIRYYALAQYFLKNGTQGARLAEYLQRGLLPAAAKLGVPAPMVILEALAAPHMPQVLTVTGHASLDELAQSRARLKADAAHSQAVANWEAGDEPPYERYAESILAAEHYSPEPRPADPAPPAPRVFELRVYHSPTERQLKALHERFAGPEIRIFHRCGIHPLFYCSTLAGPDKPNLVYLTPFGSLAAREKAWAAFAADPEWVKVRAESIARHGQISSIIQISLYRATPSSPIR